MDQPHTAETGGTTREGGLMARVRESANTQLSNQKDRATEGLGSVAQAMRQSTQQLRDQQHGTIAQYIDGAADQLEQLAGRLRDRDVGELVEGAQQLARRRPALFIGSAFAAGLLGARFLKSSAEQGNGAGGPRFEPVHASGTGYAAPEIR